MNQTLQSSGQIFQRELGNASLNNFELNWAKNLITDMLKHVNSRLGIKDAHMVPDENVTKLERDAEQVVEDVQDIEKEQENR